MDLDEMKAGWSVLNERLAQNEISNQRIIKEMIATRTRSAYDKIYNHEWRELIIILAVAILVIPCGMFWDGIHMKCASLVLIETILFFALLFYGWVVYCLSKFNLETSTTSELSRLVLKYKRYRWYNEVYGTAIALSVVAIFLFLESKHLNIYAVSTTVVMISIGLSVSFIQLRKHKQLINEIEKGLDELKEFEKE